MDCTCFLLQRSNLYSFGHLWVFYSFSSQFPFAAQNNCKTRHLAKLLIHLAWCLQEAISTSGGPSLVYGKAVNAVYISSVFLKYLIENAKSDKIEELYLSLDESEPMPTDITRGNSLVFFSLQMMSNQEQAFLWNLFHDFLISNDILSSPESLK